MVEREQSIFHSTPIGSIAASGHRIRRLDFLIETSASEGPAALGGSAGEAEDFCGFLEGETAKTVALDAFGILLVLIHPISAFSRRSASSLLKPWRWRNTLTPTTGG